MLRVRGFTQDDSHIFCTPDQVEDEVDGVIDLVDYMMQTFGYTYSAYLATRPEKSVGTEEAWEHATRDCSDARSNGASMAYEVDEGGGTFYGAEDRHQTRRCARPRVAGADDPGRLSTA